MQDKFDWTHKRVPQDLIPEIVVHDHKYKALLEKARMAQEAYQDAQHQIGDLFADITDKLAAAGVVEKGKPYHLHSEYAEQLGLAIVSMPEPHDGAKRVLN